MLIFEENVKRVSRLVLFSFQLFLLLLVLKGCQCEEKEKDSLIQAIEDYENAWASGDFLTVERFLPKMPNDCTPNLTSGIGKKSNAILMRGQPYQKMIQFHLLRTLGKTTGNTSK